MLKAIEVPTPGFERVVRFIDDTVGLEASIAIHNTNLGPGLGGCRAMEYESFDSALEDNLNLAKGMTYKNAIAGLALGGGKSVINTRGKPLTEDMLKSFGDALNHVNKDGECYFTAGDVGTSPADLGVIASVTEFVNGDKGTDSGVATAYGVFNAMKGAMRARNRGIEDVTAGVVGIGKVGKRLVSFLKDAGARAAFGDISFEGVMSLAEEVRTPGQIGFLDHRMAPAFGNVYSPCAVGGAIDWSAMSLMPDGHIVCGGANCQLAKEEYGQQMLDRGIDYVPDYVANAGGVIIISKRGKNFVDLEYDSPEVKTKLENIENTVFDIIVRSREENVPTNVIADKMAEEIFNA